MDLRKIKKLIELLEDSALTEMEITEGENTTRLSRANVQPMHAAPMLSHASSPAPSPPASLATPAATQATPQATAESPAAKPPAGQPDASPIAATPAIAGKVVESPLVGTFYNSPSPDDKPYVAVGSTVSVGDTLCLIEAMKTFNQVEAESAGVITVIYKNNGEPVEYGEPLFVIEGRDE